MFQKLIAAAAWACLIFIIYATLAHADGRPALTTTEPELVVVLERFGAYGLLGLLFCSAYPSRIGLVCVLVFGSAIVLELLQIVIPDRDARVIDAVEKLTGGAAGIASCRAFLSVVGRLGSDL
jgi:VanZ family protein